MEVRLLGFNDKRSVEERVKIVAAAGKLSRYPGSVFDSLDSCNDFDKNIKLVERIIKMGHESITDHDYLVFGLKDVSPVMEHLLIKERIISFTIKSRREVDFSTVGYYVPNFRDNNGEILKNNKQLQSEYKVHMDSLFKHYAYFVENGINKEDSRFVLPYCYYSNIIMGCDAHVLKNIIVRLTKGKDSQMPEAKELGQKLLDVVRDQVPYLVSVIENAQIETSIENYLLNIVNERPNYNLVDKVKLLSCSDDIDETIIMSSLMRLYQLDDKAAKSLYQQLNKEVPNFKYDYIMAINNDFEKLDFTQVNFRFQLSLTLAVLTHLSRHRIHDLLMPDFVPVSNLDNYIIPPSIKKLDEGLYRDIYRNNKKMYEYFKGQGVCEADLVYFHLSGNMVNVVTNINGKNLGWITRLRRCNKAQWEIRAVANQMAALVSEKSEYFSKVLGPDCEVKFICSEGKESCGKIDIILKNREKVGV